MIVISKIRSVREEYTILNFPPTICRANQLNYYTDLLPQNVMAVLGNLMVVIIGWIIHKVCLYVCVRVWVCACVNKAI